jgi:hypothetical protein
VTETQTTSSTTTSQAPSATIDSVNQNGQPISGYVTALYNGNGRPIRIGFTPKTFSGLTTGDSYSVGLASQGDCTFEHWQGTTNSGHLSFTASGAQTFTGVYKCTNAAPAAASGATSTPLPLAAFSLVIGSTLLIGGQAARTTENKAHKSTSR